MLSSIHPLGERSRNNRFVVTATAHAVGAAAGGFAVGVLAGTAAVAVALLPVTARWIVVAVAAVGAVVVEVRRRGRALPSWPRQVNEDWLSRYRGWVYGAGFGVQLGGAVFTYVTTPLVYLMLVVAVASGRFGGAVAVVTTFGITRGLAVFVAGPVRSSDGLRRLHTDLARVAGPARWMATGTAAGVALVAVGAVW